MATLLTNLVLLSTIDQTRLPRSAAERPSCCVSAVRARAAGTAGQPISGWPTASGPRSNLCFGDGARRNREDHMDFKCYRCGAIVASLTSTYVDLDKIA